MRSVIVPSRVYDLTTSVTMADMVALLNKYVVINKYV